MPVASGADGKQIQAQPAANGYCELNKAHPSRHTIPWQAGTALRADWDAIAMWHWGGTLHKGHVCRTPSCIRS
eukprot:5873862-Amphidinium_carterae.1